jgi:hypothetical protein
VLFDPGEYPMNPAWLIGKKAGHHGHGEPPTPPAKDAEKGEATKPPGD